MAEQKTEDMRLRQSSLIQDADYIPSGETTDTPWVRPPRERNMAVTAMAPVCVILAGLVLAVGWRSLEAPAQAEEDPGVRVIAQAIPPLSGTPETECPLLGVSARTVSGPAAVYYSAKDDALVPGAQIYDVQEGGTAEKAGLRSGDIITAMDDRTIATEEELIQAAAQLEQGKPATLTVYRGGEYVTVEMTFP